MDDRQPGDRQKKTAQTREERLKAELRANLARRKQQSRARRQGAEDDRPGSFASEEDRSS